MKRAVASVAATLLLTALLAGAISGCSLSASAPEEFLRSHSAVVDLSEQGSLAPFALLDEDIAHYKVFFSGETHSIAANWTSEFKLLQYLNQKADVTHYLGEFPYSMGELVNDYLTTGDESLLRLFHADAPGNAATSQDNYDFWVKVRTYNQTLPPDRKIRVVGLDGELGSHLAFAFLAHLLPQSSAPSEIAPVLAEVGQFADPKMTPGGRVYTDDAVQFQARLKQSMRKYPDLYKQYLGADWPRFERAVSGIDDGIAERSLSKSSTPAFHTARERVFYKRLQEAMAQYPDARWYGEWGAEHTYQKVRHFDLYSEDLPKVAQYLNETLPETKGKVLTIMNVYVNSLMMNSAPPYDAVRVQSYQAELFKHTPAGEAVLFKLTGKDSPFASKLYLVKDGTGGVTTDYFQYVMLIRNSEKARLFQDKMK